jgi:hypothetical protein
MYHICVMAFIRTPATVSIRSLQEYMSISRTMRCGPSVVSNLQDILARCSFAALRVISYDGLLLLRWSSDNDVDPNRWTDIYKHAQEKEYKTCHWTEDGRISRPNRRSR